MPAYNEFDIDSDLISYYKSYILIYIIYYIITNKVKSIANKLLFNIMLTLIDYWEDKIIKNCEGDRIKD